MNAITKMSQLQHWATLINECNQSGLSIHKWCKANRISTGSFYYHKNKLSQELGDQYLLKDITKPEVESAAVVLPMESPQVESLCSFVPDVVIKTDKVTVGISNTASSSLVEQIERMIRNAV